MRRRQSRRKPAKALGSLVAAGALLAVPMASAQAYDPTGGILYQLGDEPCLKGRFNCAVYPKSAELPADGWSLRSRSPPSCRQSGSADGRDPPGLQERRRRHELAAAVRGQGSGLPLHDPRYARYTSNWTNPYLYVLPQNVGACSRAPCCWRVSCRGTTTTTKSTRRPTRLDTVQRRRPQGPGDRPVLERRRRQDAGRSLNVIATAGWQGGSAGAVGQNIAAANTHRAGGSPLGAVPDGLRRQARLLLLRRERLPRLRPDHRRPEAGPRQRHRPDSHGQILAHKTWNGSSAAAGAPRSSTSPGPTDDMGGGKTEIGGGRPGMTNVVPTTDGQWLLTFEYWARRCQHPVRDRRRPLKFLPRRPRRQVRHLAAGRRRFPAARERRQPCPHPLPDGRLVYNASEQRQRLGQRERAQRRRVDGVPDDLVVPAYSRNLQYVDGTGRVVDPGRTRASRASCSARSTSAARPAPTTSS